MLRFGRKTEYALIAVLHMGERPGCLASSREISGRYHIPPEILGKVLQALARAGLLEAVHGARGGYRLVRPLAEISLGEVIEAIEGPVRMAPCTGDHHDCSQQPTCNIQSPVSQLQAALTHFLHQVSLAGFRRAAAGHDTLAPAIAIPEDCTCSARHPPTRQPSPRPSVS